MNKINKFHLYAYLILTDTALTVTSILIPWVITAHSNGTAILSLTNSMYIITAIFTLPILGIMIDRYSRRHIMIALCFIVTPLFYGGYYFADNSSISLYIYTLTFVAFGYSFRILGIAPDAIIKQETPPQHLNKTLWECHSLLQISTVLAPYLLYKVAEHVTNKDIFLYLSILMIVAVFFMIAFKENNPTPKQTKSVKAEVQNSVRAYKQHFNLIVLIALSGLTFISNRMYQIITPYYFRENLGLDLSDISLLMTINAISGALGIFAMRYAKNITIGHIKLSLTTFIIVATFISIIAEYNNFLYMSIAFAILNFIGAVSGIAKVMYVAQIVDSQDIGKVKSAAMTITSVLQLIATGFIGVIFYAGFEEYGFYYTTFILTVFWLGFLYFNRRVQREKCATA